MNKNKIGITNTMSNGLKATVIQYNNCNDLIIQWEDGEQQSIKSLAHFKDGKIAKPDQTPEYKARQRIGETRIMSCGIQATIVEYFSSHNITIQWEDGKRSYRKYYRDFINGQITHNQNQSLIKEKQHNAANKRLNTTIQMQNGRTATCIHWTSDTNFHIQFDDGITINERNWNNFTNGLVSEKYEKIKSILGTTIVAKNGQDMTLIEYHSWRDCTVQFEDNTIVYHQRFEKFKNGDIVNPNLRIKSHTSINEFYIVQILKQYGFKKYPSGTLKAYGLGRMELDCFNEQYKIAIEYDGEVHNFRPNTDMKKNEACQRAGIKLIRIREGKLGTMNSTSIDFIVKNQRPLNKELQRVMQDVIQYINGVSDININPQIAIIKNYEQTYENFNKIYINDIIGQKQISKDGYEAIIIKYRNCHDIVMQFADGVEKNTDYQSFKNGNFYKIKPRPTLKRERIGETRIMNNGNRAVIIEYRNCNDIDVQFENNHIYHTTYDKFKKGLVPRKLI